MKRLQCVVLAAIMALGSVGAAGAVDIKAKGTWDFVFGWVDNQDFNDQDGEDDFRARQRMRTQFNFVVSESLQGALHFEIGTLDWGRTSAAAKDTDGKTVVAANGPGGSAGGAIDTDGINIKTKHAYVDWLIPSTDVSVRMGLQPLVLPNATKRGNPILNSDVAALAVTAPLTEQVALTAVWARPFNQNNEEDEDYNSADEVDIFGLILPITLDGVKITPYAAYSSIGAASGFYEYAMGASGGGGGSNRNGGDFVNNDSANVWWGGLALEVTAFDPLTFGLDVMYGHHDEIELEGTSGDRLEFETEGWLIAATVDYKLDWGSVGLFGWYSTGDDDDYGKNGELEGGHLPVIGFDTGFGFGSFGYGSAVVNSSLLGYGALGSTSLGTWGLGLQAANWSFVDKLDHTLRFIYYRGTNDSEVVERFGSDILDLKYSGETVYLTDEDQAFEINFVNTYKIYDNLTAVVDISWIHLDMDEDVWGDDYKEDDAWKAQLLLRYAF
jgi:hypothetical protein